MSEQQAVNGRDTSARAAITITLPDFLTVEEIKLASRLFEQCERNGNHFAALCDDQIITPVLERINKSLHQDNNARFLAYVVEYAMRQSGRIV